MDNGSGFRLRRTNSRPTKDGDQPDKHYKYFNHDFNHSPIRPTEVPSRCAVSGALALVLRMSRVLGIAPLAIEQQDSGSWEIRVSKTATIYSMVLISAFNSPSSKSMRMAIWSSVLPDLIALSAVSLDISVSHERSVRMRNPTKGVVWLIDFFAIILTNNVSAYTAPATMRSMIGFVSRIQKISSGINHNVIPARIEKRLMVMVVFFVSLTIAVFVFDIYIVAAYAIHNNLNRIVACLFIALYCLHFNLILVNLQFALTVLIINCALKTINDHLDRLSYIIIDKGIENIEDSALIERHEILSGFTVPLKSINIVIDKITTFKDIKQLKKKTAAETIRVLGKSYLDICELIEDVDKCFGVINLTMLLTYLVHLVITSYYLLAALLMQADTKKRIITMELTWLIKLVIDLLLLVEPCNWTYQELTRTRKLMSQLACRTATALGLVVVELRKFFWCICLNKVLYAPMGVCTLRRPLYAVILGAVTTYLVVVMQFNTKEDANDR